MEAILVSNSTTYLGITYGIRKFHSWLLLNRMKNAMKSLYIHILTHEQQDKFRMISLVLYQLNQNQSGLICVLNKGKKLMSARASNFFANRRLSWGMDD